MIYCDNIYWLFYLKGNGQIDHFEIVDPSLIYAVKRKKGQAKTHYYAIQIKGDNEYGINKQYKIVAAYDPKAKSQATTFVLHSKGYLLGSNYYSYPRYINNYRILMMRKHIEEFHLRGLKEGFHLKYHIKIPLDLLERIVQKSGNKNEQKLTITNVKDSIVSDFKRCLSGKANSIFTSFVYTDNSSNKHEVDIITLDAGNHDEQYTKILELYERYIGQGFGSINSLRGVGSENNMASGSEVRNFYNLSVIQQSDNRRILLEFLKVIGRINGWPRLEWMITDSYTTTGDQSHNGLTQNAGHGE